MNADRAIEVRLRGAHHHGDRDALDDLRRVLAEHVRADHLLRRLVDHQLHQRLPGPAGQGVAHRRELASGRCPPAHARSLLLGQPDRGDRRRGEHRGRHVPQRDGRAAGRRTACRPARGPRRSPPASGSPGRSRRPSRRCAAGWSRSCSSTTHRALGVQRHAGLLEAETRGVGAPAGGEEHQVGAQGLAVAEGQDACVAVGLEPRRQAAGCSTMPCAVSASARPRGCRGRSRAAAAAGGRPDAPRRRALAKMPANSTAI